MKSGLEKLITSDRAAFDTGKPSEGHEGRFFDMLTATGEVKQTKKPIFKRRNLLSIASLAAAVTLAAILVNPLFDMDEEEYSQFIEAADYFAWELRNKAEEVKALAVSIEPSYRSEVIADIEMLSELNLDHIPGGVLSEEEKIGLLFEHYQAKSSSLDMIGNSLQTLNANTVPQ